MKLIEATLTLQSAFATRKVQVSAFRRLDAVEIMQSFMRARNAREKHLQTRSQIARCQAVLRGTLVRQRQFTYLESTISELRKELLLLWDDTTTSLMYRAKFWIVYEKANYLNLAIHYEEIERCKNMLKRFETSKKAKQESGSRFEQEKKELKRMLKEEVPEQVRESVYSTFNINNKSKHKKDTLMNSLFNTKDINNGKYTAKLCSTTLLTICSTQAAAIMDVTSQVELRRAERIRKNLMLTVMGSMSSIQSLQRGLQTQINKNRKQTKKIDALKEELGHTNEKLKKYKQHHRNSRHSRKYIFQTNPNAVLGVQNTMPLGVYRNTSGSQSVTIGANMTGTVVSGTVVSGTAVTTAMSPISPSIYSEPASPMFDEKYKHWGRDNSTNM